MKQHDLIETTITIVVAYVSNNHVRQCELQSLIHNTYNSLAIAPCDQLKTSPPNYSATKRQISESIQVEYLVSFINGCKYKTLRRHLKAHGLTPERYMVRYALPDDYPMVSAAYSSVRSRIAKNIKLGQKAL